MLNVIKQYADDGVRFTHILNIKVSNENSNLVGGKIRKYIFKKIDGVNFIPGQFTLRWVSNKRQTSSYYIANSPFSDTITAQITGTALRQVVNELQLNFNYDWTVMGLAYLITKPLSQGIPIVQEIIQPTKQEDATATSQDCFTPDQEEEIMKHSSNLMTNIQ